MTKSQKLHEALAILTVMQGALMIKFGSLRMDKRTIKRLDPHAKAVVAAMENMENELLALIAAQSKGTES